MLSLYRRHLKNCPHRNKGQHYAKCSCPIWCDGEINGERRRESLKMRDWQRAGRKLVELEDPKAVRRKPVADAVAAFETSIFPDLESSTRRKYKNVLRHFEAYCEGAGLRDLADLKLEDMDGYRSGRTLAKTTQQKELETLRQFLTFCRDRNWIEGNPAKKIKTPKNIKPTEVIPYTSTEVTRMVTACDLMGRGSYERRRARAMILLLHHTALRVSDVATLARDRIKDGKVHVRTLKTGGMVYLDVPFDLQNALDALAPPRGAPAEPRFYFWNGVTSRRAVVGIAERSLAAVFKLSGVPRAHAHRFRHTLATRLLGIGASEGEVGDVLGISANVVRKHYAKWSLARQERINGLMKALQVGTNLVREENPSVTH